MEKTFVLFTILLAAQYTSVFHTYANVLQQNCLQGVWNNFDFSRSADDWLGALRKFGGGNGVVDLVVAQASNEDVVLFPFPFEDNGYLGSYSESDLAEPFLEKFDSENLQVILSIQPLKSNVTRIIDILLSRYRHHSSLIGVNVDLEWKQSGSPNRVSDEERDLWLTEIKDKGSELKLFLTYFKDHSYFPQDSADLVVLFDGDSDTQANLLKRYRELANYYGSVGIYTGYSSSSPPTASYQRIMDAVPKTMYIIHTDDVFSDKSTLIFEMNDVEVGWNEWTTIGLAELHLKKNMPLVCGVVPKNLDNSSSGGGFLPSYLKDLHRNYFDIFEIAQLGYTNDDSEALHGKSYDEQKTIMKEGLKVLNSIGIEPSTFIPPGGSADETTLRVAEELGFSSFVDLYENMSSSKLFILNSWVTLTETSNSTTILKSSAQLMAEIDNKTDQSPIIISYDVKDFVVDTQNKLRLSKIIDSLRSSEKYLFMTAKQYKETLGAESALPETTPKWPILPSWALCLITGTLTTVAVTVLLVRRYCSQKKSQHDEKRHTRTETGCITKRGFW